MHSISTINSMHLGEMIPADEMPPMSKGNQNFQSDEMPLTNEGNHDCHAGFASSSLGQVTSVDDDLPPIVVDVKQDASDDANQDSHSDNDQLDEQTASAISSKRKRYRRHTQYQIHEMEAFFKQCPHPNEKQKRELGYKLGLDSSQIKFWFQNKRTQMKAQQAREENTQLRAENEKLRCENTKLKQRISESTCSNCGNPQTLAIPSEEHQLMLDNARLIQEIERLTAKVKSVFGHTGKSYPPSLSLNQGSLEFGERALGGQEDDILSRDMFGWSQSFWSLSGISEGDKSSVIERAVSAAEELALMALGGEPLWIPDLHRNTLVLNEKEYFKTFQSEFVPKPLGFKSEASRECDVVLMSPSNILDIFMELNKWLAVFSCIISKAKLYEVLSTGVEGNYNGAMQVMAAEFRVLSLVVPTRDFDFVRYCKQLNEETWAIVDVSMDSLLPRGQIARCHRRPSGCVIEAMPNGYSKITWVEHVEVPDEIIHSISRSIISSGHAYGAKRWISILKRQCERLAYAMDITNHPYIEDLNETALPDPEGRQNILKLAERMVLNFYGGVTTSSGTYHWTTVLGNGVDEVRIMIRKSIDDPGRPSGVVLSASICFWIPVHPKIVFDYLRNHSTRAEWDILSNGGSVEEMAHISNGQETSNCITVLRVTNPQSNHGNMLILQECSSEPTASLIVYAPVDTISINMLFGDGDPANVQLLPSGFTILPSGPPGCQGGIDDDSITNGTVLCIALQILVDFDPYAKLSVASIATVNNLIESTAEKIKIALGVD